MTVKEFIDVVNFEVVDYANIHEMCWDAMYKEYKDFYTGKRVLSCKDLELYYDCELDRFELEMPYGEYNDSSIYIKMPKPVYNNGEIIWRPCCGTAIVVELDNVKCDVCGWTSE